MSKLSEKVRDCLNYKCQCNNDGCLAGNGVIVCSDLLNNVYNALSLYESLLPCQVGTKLYKMHRGTIATYTVAEIQVFLADGILASCLKCTACGVDGCVGGFVHVPSNWVGKEIFFTVEEAETYYQKRRI